MHKWRGAQGESNVVNLIRVFRCMGTCILRPKDKGVWSNPSGF